MKVIAIGLIRLYQNSLRPLIPDTCRFEPSCSNYCIEALQKHRIWKGFYIGLRRVFRCHPFHPGGYDPVK